MKPSIVTTALALIALPAFAGSSAPAINQTAITTSEPSAWRFQFDLYGWAESLEGDVGLGRLSVPVDIGFDDILEDLDIAAMGAVGIGYGRWSFLADFIYAEVEADTSVLRGRVPLKVKEEQFLGNFVLGYEVLNTGTMDLGVYAGARVNSIDVEISTPRFNRSRDESWVDPIVGARFQADLSDSLFFRAVGDIGGFGVSSDLTWQAMAGFGYRVMDSGAILLGYRGLGTDYSDGGFTYDVIGHGPVIGFEYKF